MKHTPATPLPTLTAEIDALMPRGDCYIVHATTNGLRSIVAKVNGELIAPEHGTPKELSAYIAHAANAYPRLVEQAKESLARIHQFRNEMRGYNADATGRMFDAAIRIESLLRELGEVE